MTKIPDSKRATFVIASIGVLVIVVGFVIAPVLSCVEVPISGYGPSVYKCPDGMYYWGVNPHPYFDALIPWLLGGLLVLFWAAYRYETSRSKTA